MLHLIPSSSWKKNFIRTMPLTVLNQSHNKIINTFKFSLPKPFSIYTPSLPRCVTEIKNYHKFNLTYEWRTTKIRSDNQRWAIVLNTKYVYVFAECKKRMFYVKLTGLLAVWTFKNLMPWNLQYSVRLCYRKHFHVFSTKVNLWQESYQNQ